MLKKEIYQLYKKVDTKKIDEIILNITGFSKSELFLKEKIEDKYKEEIILKIDKIKKWIPLEYITNKAEFYSLIFFVDYRVLIPRNDTEIMVDKAIEEIILKDKYSLIDIWTWSSCIAISIVKNTEKIKKCYVIDISKKALEVSKKNIINHKLEKKIEQVNSNLLSEIIGTNQYHIEKDVIITANLPYIKNNDFENIDKETLEFEPSLALYWWKNTWFELYEKLIKECFKFKEINHLNSLVLFIEIGFDQYYYSSKYLKNLDLQFKYYKDNSWIDRCIKIKF